MNALDPLHAEMDRIFEQFFDGAWPSDAQRPPQAGVPTAIELTESDAEVVVRAEIPGVERDAIQVTFDDGVLTISGEKKDELDQDADGRRYCERRYGAFQRSVHLATPVDGDSVAAEHKNGVLTVRLKKAKVAQPKKIAVREG